MIIDELRLIEHTNTQVRYLPIVSQILRTIGSRSTSLIVLKDVLRKWSIEQERKSTFYKNHNGILTNDEKPTTAFPYYIELMMNLGLLTKINEVVRNSKYGTLFLTLDKFNNEKVLFSEIEKLFFLFFILSKDADNIILLLQIIDENNGAADNNFLRDKYEEYLKNRLKIKAMNSSTFSQNAIIEKLRKIEYVWQKAKEYSKHIIPPRIEWLVDLGILQLSEKSKIKTFEFSNLGRKFYYSLEFIDKSQIRDINDSWLVDKFISEFHYLCERNIPIKNFDSLDENSRNKFLNDILPKAYKELDADGLSRISGLPFYVFIMIIGLVEYNTAVSFSSIKNLLTKSFSTNEYTFAFREATRINESYLTVSIK